MTLKSRKLVPVSLCICVAGLMVLLQLFSHYDESFDFVRRLEWMTFDWRVRQAQDYPSPKAPNLGFVYVDNETIQRVLSGQFGYKAGLYWPRHVYGRIVQELGKQGAGAIAFDVVFAEPRPDHPAAELADGSKEPSDLYFARQIRQVGNVILGAEEGTVPPPIFRTNAWAIGDIDAKRDGDGILRRAKAFEDYLVWHPAILQASNAFDGFHFNTNFLLFTATNGVRTQIPITANGTFDLGSLLEIGNETTLPTNVRRSARAFTRYRAWDLGLAAAACQLKLDLTNAIVEPGHRILLRSAGGEERVIPIDADGRFYIDWSLKVRDPELSQESAHSLLNLHHQRELGQTNDLKTLWAGKLAVIGSRATGNDLTDFGATPLEEATFLTSRFLNTANSLLLGRFIQQPDLGLKISLILALSLLAGILTWNLRALVAAICVALLGAVYLSLSLYLYTDARYWLPLVLPAGGLFITHFALISYRVVFEQRERRRIRNIFAKIVSPNVVNELLGAEKLALGGARREVTVFFSDVRGFTEMTDESHAAAEEFVREHKLLGTEAEAYFDDRAKEVLATVNLYLGTIADTVKKHEGTLDKYIGDCVMAFWGAPTPNGRHALDCVRAAIDAQRAIYALNQERAAENKRREQENAQRAQHGLPALPILKLLAMGSGVNTGIVTVGLMGSERHTFNYTVFGRDVNLASRLEGLSGRGRILIGEATYRMLQKDDPGLAVACQELAPTTPKGFRTPVKIYEVPWREVTQLHARAVTPQALNQGTALAP